MKRKSIRIFAILAVMVLIVSIITVGCAPQPTTPPETEVEEPVAEEPEPEEPEPVEGGQLVIPMWSGPEYENLVKVAEIYEEETGVEIIVEEIARDAYETKLTTVLLAGAPDYDVVYINASFLPKHVEAQTLEPLETFGVENNPNLPDLKPAVDALYYKGNLYGLPTEADGVYLYYRKDILEEHGIEPPDTWADFLEAAKEVNSPPDYYGTVVAAKLPTYVFYDFSSWLLGAGGTWLDENYMPQWDTPEALEALNRYVAAVEEGYAPPDATAIEYPEQNSWFQEGKLAMMVQWVAARDELIDCERSPIVCENMDVKIVPAHDTGRSILGSLYSWSIPASSEKQELAYDFLDWVTSPEGAKVWALNGGIPANQKALTDPDVLEVRPDFELLAESLMYVRTPPITTVTSDLVHMASLEINAAVAGETTPEEAVKSIQEQWTESLKEGGYLEPVAEEPEPVEGGQLVIPMWSGPEYENLVKVAEIYEEETGVEVIVEEIARDAYETKLTTVLLAGAPDYDVVYINASFLPKHVEAQTLEPLETFGVENNPNLPDLKPAVDALYYKGNLYGLPTEADGVYLYYRTDILEEHGIEPPDTWADLLEAAKEVNSPPDYYGTVVAAKLPTYVFYDFSSWLLGAGGTWLDENYMPQWDTPEALEALNRYVAAVEEGYAPPDATAIEYPEQNSWFQEGKLAMMVQWVAARAELIDCERSPIVCENMDVKIVPAHDAGRSILGSLYSWSIPAASENQELAYDFIDWVTSPEGAKVWALNGGIPANQKALTDPDVLEVRPDFELLAESLKYVRTPPITTVTSDIVHMAALEINAAVAGQKTPEEAVQAIQEQWIEALKEGGYIE